MFARLLLFACACALSAAEVPQYEEIVESILKAHKIIVDNILSMDGNIPLLNDSRRHFAEIFYVVAYEASAESSCLGHDYYEDYQENINKAAAFAIARPQKVVDGTKEVLQIIFHRLGVLLQLINAKTQALANRDQQNINEAIDEEINNNIEKYGNAREILLSLGIVATQINNNHENYYAVESKNLSAHSFVINGVEKLKKHVMAGANFYRNLRVHC